MLNNYIRSNWKLSTEITVEPLVTKSEITAPILGMDFLSAFLIREMMIYFEEKLGSHNIYSNHSELLKPFLNLCRKSCSKVFIKRKIVNNEGRVKRKIEN